MTTKRWYDLEPTLSLAISMIKNSNEEKQDAVCELINSKMEELGVQKNSKFILFKVFDKRWYDEKENIYNALEYLRCSDEDTRRAIALEVIDYLCNVVRY